MTIRIGVAVMALFLCIHGQGKATQFATMPAPPPEVLVPADTTVVAALGSAPVAERAGEAVLMWGLAGPARTPGVIPSTLTFFEGDQDATAAQVAIAATAIRDAIGARNGQLRADLVHVANSPEFLGKITATIPQPKPEQLDRVIGAVRAKLDANSINARSVGVWYRPRSSCAVLAARSATAAAESATEDIRTLGSVFGLRTGELLLSQSRSVPTALTSPNLCTPEIPRLPLNAYAVPRSAAPAQVVVDNPQVVAYAMQLQAQTRQDRALHGSVSPDTDTFASYEAPFVHLRLASATQFSSTGSARAHPSLSGVLIEMPVYSAASAITQALHTAGFDAAFTSRQDGQFSIGILLYDFRATEIARVTNAMQHAALAAGQNYQVDLQAVPFAATCARSRAAALAAAARGAKEHDAALAQLSGRRITRPRAIIEEHVMQDVVCGPPPRNTSESMTRIDPLVAYTYVPNALGYIEASVEVDYAAR